MALSIKFINLSKTDFNRSLYGEDLADFVNNVKLPDTVMKHGSTQIMEIDNDMGFAGHFYSKFWCCWIDPTTGARFGVHIGCGGQPFNVGWQPVWQVMGDHSSSNAPARWVASGKDPAEPYNWPTSIGYNIGGSPVASHTALAVTVTIQSLT
ncbi:hypothetical protein [Flagellimonas sp.]|uniref:hypothetical protein n=1 Tax=Flagellimonas sp. TaxID=2058762 RepID=UPI0034AAA14B